MSSRREGVVGLALFMLVVFLAAGGTLAVLGQFVRTVTMLAVSVACAAIVLMLDRVKR